MWHWEAYQFIHVGHRAKSIILSSLFGGRMLSVLYALILISAYILFLSFLSMFTIEALFFFLSSWYPMWFETFYLILFLIRMVAFSVYIYISSLSARMEEFFFYDYSYFARPNFGMMCMPASSIVAEVVYFQRVMVSI